MVFAPDEGSEAMLHLKISFDVEITAFRFLFLGKAQESFFKTGVPHLLVDVISVNNARYCDKEGASGGHYL